MGIKYYQIKPSPTLSDYVKFFWIGEATASKEHPFAHLSIATRSPQLLFHYKGHFAEVTATGNLRISFSSGIQGQSKTYTQFIARENAGIFGIDFYPYTIPALFSIPAATVTNQYIDLGTILGNKGKELEERIFTADTHQEKVYIATAFLESLIKRPLKPAIVAAVQMIDRSNGMIDTNTLLKNVPLSQRQLERLFTEFVGFSPKQYARVSRFESAINNFRRKKSFTEIALDAGYFDQAHFNHDFLEFTGLSPKDYLKAIDKLTVSHD